MTQIQKLLPDGRSPFLGLPLGSPTGRRLRSRLSRQRCAVALITADVAAILLSWVLVLLAAHVGAASPSGFGAPLAPRNVHASMFEFGLVFVGLVTWLAAQGHYHQRQPFWWTLRQVVLATGVAVLCNGFIEYAFKTDTSRLLVIGTWLLFPFTLVAMRHVAIRSLQATGVWAIRTVVVGSGPAAGSAASALLTERLGYEVAAVVGMEAAAHDGSAGELLHRFRAQLLVFAPDSGPAARALQEDMLRDRTPFAVMAPMQGLPVLAAEQTCFLEQDLVMLSFWKGDAQNLARLGKVVLDMGGAALLLLLLSPLLGLIALAVRLDGGPALYAHTRLGAGRQRFGCLKFRSMQTNSDAVLQRVLQTDPARAAEWAATQKLRDDPRVTKLGAVLRATSLDELPQLFNVLRGEMSLVGPRPIVDAEVAHYGQNIDYYYQARPGLTGLWQVSGRSDLNYGRRVQLDVLYVKNWTFWNDLAILWRTIPAVLKRTGAV